MSLPRLLAGLLALVVVAGTCGEEERGDPYDSVAQLHGMVCGKQILASAVVVGPDLLVTVAHNVVGSQGDLSVTFEDSIRHPVVVIGVDTDRDLALLHAPNIDTPTLITATPSRGGEGRIIRLRAEAERAQLEYTDAEPVRAVGLDIYDEPTDVSRDNVRVRASAGPGYSGAPVLDGNDRMIGLVYARARRQSLTYAVTGPEIDSFVDRVRPAQTPTPVDTNRCAP